MRTGESALCRISNEFKTFSGVSIASSAIVCAESEINGEVVIKEGCVVHPHVVFDASKGPIYIGENNIFEEFVVIRNKLV